MQLNASGSEAINSTIEWGYIWSINVILIEGIRYNRDLVFVEHISYSHQFHGQTWV